ncbi:MAG TPA: hypothetical protein VGG48_00925 [Rhizomicrobium sp.]|jgi:hypothetical protein
MSDTDNDKQAKRERLQRLQASVVKPEDADDEVCGRGERELVRDPLSPEERRKQLRERYARKFDEFDARLDNEPILGRKPYRGHDR